MLKFFRKIRQNLISEGKSLNYIKYAIGEIVLVVIGILIALEVNNWNNERKDLKKENYYLKSIKTSIQLSQNELKRVIDDAETISSSADTLFVLLTYKNYNGFKDHFLDSLIFNAGDYSIMSLNDGGIQEILNTGSLDIIRDEQVRVILASWNERVHKIRKFEEETQYFSRDFYNHIIKYFDFGRFELDSLQSAIIPEKQQELFNDPMIRNFLGRIQFLHYEMKNIYTNEKNALDSLNMIIDQYLKK